MTDGTAQVWPALDLGGREAPGQITYERGIWGKVHGAPSDFRWIAMTAALAARQTHLERELQLGAEDAPATATLWRVLNDTCYAVGFYPSDAHDASGRSRFLEKQVLEWKRPPEVPAAFGALLLLPLVASLDAKEWWEQRSDVRWSEEDHVIALAVRQLNVSTEAIEEAAAQGRDVLAASTSEDALTELYAALLAGRHAVPLRGLAGPLPAAALAALLLPLPRSIADGLSIAGWLPSTWLSESGAEEVRRCWQLVLGGATPPPEGGAAEPTAEQLGQARSMARSVLTGSSHRGRAAAAAAAESAGKPFQLALWGPSAAGKTALLAKLYLDAEDDENWQVLPTQQSLDFIQTMRTRMQTGNLFPAATSPGQVEGIEYLFRHRTSGVTCSLSLEDRAGLDSEKLQDDPSSAKISLKQRLGSADGLVLLFDPVSDEAVLEARVSRTLELLHVASGRHGQYDSRPIAVCVSKADVLIETPEDFRRAVEAPDAFVRERVSRVLVRALDLFCTNYRLFPVSAAGVRLRHGVIEPAVFIDDSLEPRLCPGGRPFNVMAPFSWLLDQLTGPV